MIEMSEAGGELGANNERLVDLPERFSVRLRGPVFDFIADKMAPAYLSEMAKLKEDGAYKPLVEFFNSPFANVTSRILDRVEETPKSPEIVVFDFSQEEVDSILKRIPEEKNYLRARISRELQDEFKTNFRDAEYTAKLKNTATKIKRKLTRRKK